MENADEYQPSMKQVSRSQIWNIWQTGKAGGELNGEEARLYQALQEHSEYAELWDHLDQASDEDIIVNGVNVVLHITFHTIMENQIADNNPPAVREVLRVIMQKGLGRHEAIHAISYALASEIFLIQRDQRPYDEQHYLRELRKVPLELARQRKKKK